MSFLIFHSLNKHKADSNVHVSLCYVDFLTLAKARALLALSNLSHRKKYIARYIHAAVYPYHEFRSLISIIVCNPRG